MTDKKQQTTYVFTEKARLRYEDLLQPYIWKDPKTGATGKPVFGATFLMRPDGPDAAAIKALVGTELRAMFPGKKFAVNRRMTQDELNDGGTVEVTVPWEDGTKKADLAKKEGKDAEEFRGLLAIKAGSIYQTVLSAVENGKIVSFENDRRGALSHMFYPGAYVYAQVKLNQKQAKKDKPGGVGLYLDSVFFSEKGERFVGKQSNPAEVFKGYAGAVSAENPGSNELDDEIPF